MAKARVMPNNNITANTGQTTLSPLIVNQNSMRAHNTWIV